MTVLALLGSADMSARRRLSGADIQQLVPEAEIGYLFEPDYEPVERD